MFAWAYTFRAFGMMPARKMVRRRKSAPLAPAVALEGGSFILCSRKSRENSIIFGGVKGGVGVEDDGVIEIGSEAVEALDDLVDDLDEPPWSRAASLWHYQPLEETRGCAEGIKRYRVRIHCYLMKRKDEIEE